MARATPKAKVRHWVRSLDRQASTQARTSITAERRLFRGRSWPGGEWPRRTKLVDASSCGNCVHHIDGGPGTQIRCVPCLAIQSVLLAETLSKLRGSVKVEDEGAGMVMTMTVYSLPRHGQLSSLGIKIVPCPRTVPLLISERRQMHSPNPFRHDLNHS
jgi:hypothetical protein